MAKSIGSYIADWMNDNARNAGDVDANVVLVRFNRRYHEIEGKIATFIADNYYDSYVGMNLVDGQATYQLPTGDSGGSSIPNIPELRKLLELSIDYVGNGRYVKADELPDGDLNKPLEFYSEHMSKHRPFFKFEGKSRITLYPTPDKDVTLGLHIRYAANTPDVSATDTEDDLTIPRQYIYVIFMGVARENAKTIKDKEVLMYKQDYYEAVENMLAEMADRYIQPTQYHNPCLAGLMN